MHYLENQKLMFGVQCYSYLALNRAGKIGQYGNHYIKKIKNNVEPHD